MRLKTQDILLVGCVGYCFFQHIDPLQAQPFSWNISGKKFQDAPLLTQLAQNSVYYWSYYLSFESCEWYDI